jgi:leucyl aminopeptidase
MFDAVRVGGRTRANVLVVGKFKDGAIDKAALAHDSGGVIAAAAKRNESTGDLGNIVEAFPGKASYDRVLIVGLGDKEGFEVGRLRDVAGAVGRRLAQTKDTGVEIDLVGPLKAVKADATQAGRAFGEGLGLIAWTCDTFRGNATTPTKRTRLDLRADDKSFESGLKKGLALAESANIARTLSQTPPNVCTPDYVAKEAQKLARKTGLSCRVIKGAQLEKDKLQGLINVGKASENPPCLIRLEYTPASPKRGAKPVVLIGKTMTYDSGGLSLKINNGMKGMKRDKDGGCAVFGAMHAVATHIKPKFPVVALLAAAENSVSDEAYRPDDVITYRNGVTVEVTNTDAEGRLVLADALCWACDKEKPGMIIDLATLTGGVVIALGSVHAGVWCDDDDLRARLECASVGSGERIWRLPHHQLYRDMMKSPIADIVNSAPVREAHPIQGAAFLSYFVETGIPWAHIDIAGVHATEKDLGPIIAGPTGYGTRLLAYLLEAS